MLKKILATTALAVAVASPALVATTTTAASAADAAAYKHPCTHTSSGSCIRGGEFCPQASYNHSGWSSTGKRYVCKGDHVHPHWMIP